MELTSTGSNIGMPSNCDIIEHRHNVIEDTDTDIKGDFGKNSTHIPYILNGELYEIQTQEGDNVTVRCCHCPPDRVYRGSVRSTGNFHMHIKRRHPDLLGKLHDMKVNALVERRDRLIRNRKITYREEMPTIQEASSFHSMHKLKIKSVFQRHQIQHQQQQQQLQQQQHKELQCRRHQQQHHQHQQNKQFQENSGWNLSPFVVVPIADSIEVYEPINYCIKANKDQGNTNVNENFIPLLRDERKREVPNRCSQIDEKSLIKCSDPQTSGKCFLFNGNSTNFDSISNLTSCPSTSSSFGSQTDCISGQYNSISVIKDELLMNEKALDLTANTTSISLSSSGLGTSSATTSTAERPFESHSAAGSLSPNIKWNDLLQQIEMSLREIQREMHTRNEIETNRLFLDLSKFKYLHPGFHYQC